MYITQSRESKNWENGESLMGKKLHAEVKDLCVGLNSGS